MGELPEMTSDACPPRRRGDSRQEHKRSTCPAQVCKPRKQRARAPPSPARPPPAPVHHPRQIFACTAALANARDLRPLAFSESWHKNHAAREHRKKFCRANSNTKGAVSQLLTTTFGIDLHPSPPANTDSRLLPPERCTETPGAR